jgi:inner membrane protein
VATPIGHALAAYAVYHFSAGTASENRRIFLGLCVLMAIAPDFDFIPGMFEGQPALYHQRISHSLGAAVVVSLVAALVYGMKTGEVCASWKWFFLAYASHLLLDFIGPDGRPPYGQPLFWPISSEYYFAPASLQLLWGVRHAKATSAITSEWISGILQPHNLGALSIEVLLTLPMVLLARCVSSLKSRRNQEPA